MQTDLSGKAVPADTGPQRSYIKIYFSTRDRLHKGKVKQLSIMQNVELGSKLSIYALNRLNREDILRIINATDWNEIDDIIKKLYVLNDNI